MMSSDPVLSTVIIGCGMIAGGYDETDRPQGITTHAAACRRHPDFTIVACVEPDEARRSAFMEFWNIGQGFADMDGLINGGVEFDAAVISAPTSEHISILRRLLNTGVKGVMCEKPICGCWRESSDIVAAYGRAGRVLAVNYPRRWNPVIVDLKERLAGGEWGALQSVVGHYGGGLINNGSHMLDLLSFLFGEVAPLSVSGVRPLSGDDFSCDVLMTVGGDAAGSMIAFDARHYGMFEMSAYLERGAFSLEDFGRVLKLRQVEDEPLVPGRKRLAAATETETGWRNAQYYAYDNFHAAVTRGVPLSSDGESALMTEKACDDIRRMAVVER